MPNFLAFDTPHEGLVLIFGVPNAKYLAFDTLLLHILVGKDCCESTDAPVFI